MSRTEEKIRDLLAMGCLQPDDPKFEFFRRFVVPSIVNEWITPSGESSYCFKCPFEHCGVLISRSILLERHLREIHHDEIPKGVFGNKRTFLCKPCNYVCKRHEHLKRHSESQIHLKTVISQGIATNEQKQKWEAICSANKNKSFLSSVNGSNSKTFKPEQKLITNETIFLDNSSSSFSNGTVFDENLEHYDLSNSWSSLTSCTFSLSQHSMHSIRSSQGSESYQEQMTSTPLAELTNQLPSKSHKFDQIDPECNKMHINKITIQSNFPNHYSNGDLNGCSNFPLSIPSAQIDPLEQLHEIDLSEFNIMAEIDEERLFNHESFINLLNGVEARQSNGNFQSIYVETYDQGVAVRQNYSEISKNNKRKFEEYLLSNSESGKNENPSYVYDELDNLLKKKRQAAVYSGVD